MFRSQPEAVTHALCQKKERRNYEEDCTINRDDPKKTACVEDLETVAGLPRIQKDSTDEEAGQNKKQVHAGASYPTEDHSVAKRRDRSCYTRNHKIVPDQ